MDDGQAQTRGIITPPLMRSGAALQSHSEAGEEDPAPGSWLFELLFDVLGGPGELWECPEPKADGAYQP